jgi:hypothetical protein
VLHGDHVAEHRVNYPPQAIPERDHGRFRGRKPQVALLSGEYLDRRRDRILAVTQSGCRRGSVKRSG